MGCASGGCASGGCSSGEGACGTGGGCSGGNCGTDSWDGNYRDVAGVKIGKNARTLYVDSTGFELLAGETCVVESDEGESYGRVVQATGASRKFASVAGMHKVLRRPTAGDDEQAEGCEKLRREALAYCRARAEELDLEMKVVEVEPSFDGKKLTCYFTAGERVDFREMVRDLAHRFRRRIEMRQIGARDEARMLGGYGICGRPLCCSTFLTEFAPISVKMAKRQGLSLNPSKISGLCGRLMCCLRYEDYDAPRGSSTGRGEGGHGSRPVRIRSRRNHESSSSSPTTSSR
ncbi:MAG TPA: regulatory iron-sulfur-containing complex subunit RicT [Candidatus Saccharimonadales bacterium]|nr:regulatory iron-sulfur-containing complex subunit RicT [Candidatus Saccharimonadales bacterium]